MKALSIGLSVGGGFVFLQIILVELLKLCKVKCSITARRSLNPSYVSNAPESQRRAFDNPMVFATQQSQQTTSSNKFKHCLLQMLPFIGQFSTFDAPPSYEVATKT